MDPSVSHPTSPPQSKPHLGLACTQRTVHFPNSLERVSQITCAYCKKDNHIMSDCFKLKKKHDS